MITSRCRSAAESHWFFRIPTCNCSTRQSSTKLRLHPCSCNGQKSSCCRGSNETMEWMGIAHLRDRPPYRLSGGEKKRVALASVVVLDPDVLLLDEPTATLDPRSQSQVIDLIQEWKGSEKTVITATHQLEIVEDIADRIVVLEAGRMRGQRHRRRDPLRSRVVVAGESGPRASAYPRIGHAFASAFTFALEA